MTTRRRLAFIAASLALHASATLALGRARVARVDEAADVWSGGAAPPEVMVEVTPPESAPPSARGASDPGPVPAVAATSGPSTASRPKRSPRRTLTRSARATTPTRASEPTASGTSKRAAGFGADSREAPRDLLRALTRAVAPANQADAAWSRAAAGRVLTGELAFELDASGRVASSSASPTTAPELVELLRRTTALLRGGTFGARAGEAGSGIQRFLVRAVITDTGAPDAAGGAIELSFEVSGGVGRAAFVRAGGRRVDVELRRVTSR